ncbi:NAD-dependent epimerase/dehydratase family protein [Thermoplasma sp.]|uniref:NAD-dependent epimerase/dehydratase family protein n=1 Tax=Thermoplasma sp. TaxID=1973142 RepID=UPI00127287D4|nr:NAD-dependent epimerase/dehydratase family protein [Thermoplasma sp.]KAA8922029.1 MAG: NAD-dependent epimerase/dehydratase family protein [Thermoplasma sp.]
MKGKHVMITGGAGFIGSNMVEMLLQDNDVTVIDNLSITDDRYIRQFMGMKNFRFIKEDITESVTPGDYDLVVHLAADSDVRNGSNDPTIDLRSNVVGTVNVLEMMRKNDVKDLLFASSSTIYGEAKITPTPENYGPLMPISSYGASKLSAEAFISSYSHYYGMNAKIFRFANIVGKNSTHGVIFDFINKLKRNSSELEVLGDGTQAKSYMHVTDCIESMFYVHEKVNGTDVFNLGNDDVTNVDTIARYVIEAMGLKDTRIVHRGGYMGRGWPGDVKYARMDVKKLKETGWKNRYNSDEAVRVAIEEIKKQIL